MTAPMHLLPGQETRRAGDLLYVSTIFPVDGGRPRRAVRFELPPHGRLGRLHAVPRWCSTSWRGAWRPTAVRWTACCGSRCNSRLLPTSVSSSWPGSMRSVKPPPPAQPSWSVDDQVVPGTLVTVNAVALNGGSAQQRETIHTDEAPDPIALRARAAGHQGWPTGCTPRPCRHATTRTASRWASDFQPSPTTPTTPPTRPSTCSPIFRRSCSRRVLAWANVIKAHLYEPDLGTFPDVDAVWAR